MTLHHSRPQRLQTAPQRPFNEALLTAALLCPPERPRQPGLVKLLFQRRQAINKPPKKPDNVKEVNWKREERVTGEAPPRRQHLE